MTKNTGEEKRRQENERALLDDIGNVLLILPITAVGIFVGLFCLLIYMFFTLGP